MVWRIELTELAVKQLGKLGSTEAKRVTRYLSERVASAEDPRSLGKALIGPLGNLWRYRVGDVRVVCELRDGACIVLVIRIGNRREVYRP